MTDRDALIARLRVIAARFDMTSTERYEQDSEAFYAQTGYMAPGKDVPMAMGGQDETERRAAHESWIAGRNRSQQQAIHEAADALAALPPPADMNTAAEHYRQGWQAGHAAADPLPPRPTGSEPINRVDLVRYGVATPGSPTLLTPMADGYWTPWHIAAQTPADPPALVALVREWQRKQRGCDIENTAAAYAELDIAEAELLAYPLPAAPPAPEPQAMPPIEVGDVARLDGFGLVTVNRPEEAGVLSLGIDGLVAVYKPVWTREPRR